MKILLTLICITFIASTLSAQDSIQRPKEYSFIIQDSPALLYTMRQSNENYLSTYRLAIGQLNKAVSPKVSKLVQVGLAVFTLPFTHEEGHRAVLSHQNIGSVSKPYFNKNLAAYVQGVTDASLIQLRNTNLPTYIRLHTAGLESDYALVLREEALLNFGKEDLKVLQTEYLFRKLNIIGYYATGLFKYDVDIKEEQDELQRDIVGHDVYGAARHLYRPDAEFYRYTRYSELTSDEQGFVKRVAWRSLLHLVNPLIVGKTGFRLHKNAQFNFGLGAGMSPFGDHIDQHFYLSTHHYNAHLYLRQHQNRSTWFPEMGIHFTDLRLTKAIQGQVSLATWNQPEQLSFTAHSGKWGGSVSVLGKYQFKTRNEKGFTAFSINLGLLAKTEGFMLEEMALDKHFGVRFGTSIWIQ